MSLFDYLAIGHVTHDRTPAGTTIGGTVAYAGRTAEALGCRTAVVTSAGPECDLTGAFAGITVKNVAAAHTTTFENQYDEEGRQQRIEQIAGSLSAADVPAAWQRASIVHLAPVAAEVDPDLVTLFSNSLVGLTPQGWLRAWDEDGRVYARAWKGARETMPLAAAVILSEEDVPDPALLEEYRQWARLLVVTRGALGCTVYLGDESETFTAPTVTARDVTGAGDIFAAAFLIRLYQTKGNPWEAATFANELAARSVTQPDLASKIAHLERVRG